MQDFFEEKEFFTLTDEDGKEIEFVLLATCEFDEKTYFALVPASEYDKARKPGDEIEFVILRLETDEKGEDILVTIDDDDEFDRVADYFEDACFDTIDYDEDGGNQ